MSPFSAFLLLSGLETLALRMEAHVANAARVAAWLEEHPAVSWVRYAGLPSSPFHALAQRYLPKGPGAVFSFGVKGGRDAGRVFIESLEVASHLANIGDTRTLVIHPASTTHQQLSDEALVACGVLARPDPHLGRHRGRRRHPLRPRPGAPQGGDGMTASPNGRGPWTAPSARERWEIIRRTKSVAMVGASSNPARPSYFVATYLLSSSCSFENVWFVNPAADEILGRPVYKSLADLPGPPDLVDVFRKPADLPEVADEAIAAGAKTLWLQLGLWDEAVAQHAPTPASTWS